MIWMNALNLSTNKTSCQTEAGTENIRCHSIHLSDPQKSISDQL